MQILSIDFRDIVKILDIDAPVHFTPKDKINKKNYVFCRFMGNDECAAIISGRHDPNASYDNCDIGLHFPDIDVEEYCALETIRNPVAISSYINNISNQMPVYLSEIEVLFAIHCVLHEYGHWLYFLSTGMTSFEYCEAEKKERQPYENTAKEIYDMPDWHPNKRILAEKYEKEIYSQFSSELAANQYALEHIMEAMVKVREFLGYTEQDLIDQ